MLPPLIETRDLAQRLATEAGRQKTRVVDATYFVPPSDKNALAEFEVRHIPSAVFFDIDTVKDPTSLLPHMLPEADAFGEAVGALGIGNEHDVVVYDQHGIFSAPRVWWMFRVFGHENVAVLNGGLPQWLSENRELGYGQPAVTPATFSATLQPRLVADVRDLQAVLTGKQPGRIVDMRGEGRFEGTQPEPRQGIPSGHMPGAVNLPWNRFVDPATHRMKTSAALRDILSAASAGSDTPILCTCGSGVTACMAAFALHLTGEDNWSVYDGSWAEWATRHADDPEAFPIEARKPTTPTAF
ncbi:MAG: sulfurtransferase [Candidatus Melainabacteria bacterium]